MIEDQRGPKKARATKAESRTLSGRHDLSFLDHDIIMVNPLSRGRAN